MIKAIETSYGGYKFRSMLEARWAVAFDLLGVRYRYEDQGYDVNGKWYLPDFVLPSLNAIIEVKGPQEYDHALLYCLSVNHECDVYMAFDSIPDVRNHYGYLKKVGRNGEFDPAQFYFCRECGRLHISTKRCEQHMLEQHAQCFDIARQEDFKKPSSEVAASRQKAISGLSASQRTGLFASNWHQREKLLALQAQGRN